MPDIQIGIMQGRFSSSLNNKIQSFPTDSWRLEFEKAANCGYESLEWIFDSITNPILSNDDITEIIDLEQRHKIKINSLLADYFMDHKLFNVSEFELDKNTRILKKLIEQCRKSKISIIEIPLVDSASLKSKDDEDQLILNLNHVLPYANDNGIILNLETDLKPQSFSDLISKFDYENIFVNYDTGNSASLGYDVIDELTILGDKIRNIHIKDRLFEGKTVPLGEGDVNFEAFFSKLKQIGYSGDIIIQGAREENVSPEETCKKYLKFVKQYVHKYF